MDMSEMDKEQELVSEIRKLKRQLAIANSRVKTVKYGLVWMEVPETFDDESENQLPVIEEVKEKSIRNKDEKPTHILIEGDNYHALTCLNYTHKEKVDIIYIDPPYNTGSDGFRYKDKRILDKFPDGSDVPKDHPLKHSYWLSFMNKRLELAYNLLKPEGVIFISINEDEYAQLKLLCDHIFQASNYMTTFTVKVRHEDRILKGDKDYHETTEQLLLYRKSPKFKSIKRLQDNSSIEKYIYTIEELIDNPEQITMGSKVVSVFKPGEYRIVKSTPSADKFQKINIRGSLKEGNSSGRFYMKYLEERNNLFGYLYKVPDMGRDMYGYRYFLTRESEAKVNSSYFQGIPLNRKELKEVPYPNYIDFEEAFNNVGYEGGVEFRNGKKPVDFLKFIFSIGSFNKNAVILDFFAGSGTTGHAVMEQNYIDGGRRQVILCTNNENNIANEVTYPRIKNVIQGYSQSKNQKEVLYEVTLNTGLLLDNSVIHAARERFFSEEYTSRYDEIKEEVRKNKYTIYGVIKKGKRVPGLGNSLKYYKTSFVGNNDILSVSDKERVNQARKAGYLLALIENTLDEAESTSYFQLFENDGNTTAIYFREESDEIDALIKKLEGIRMPKVLYVVNRENHCGFENRFAHIDNLTIKKMPQPILDIYKNIPVINAVANGDTISMDTMIEEIK